MTDLREAREELFTRLDDGVRCPCCDQYARRYRRNFNSTMARSLLWLVKSWLHREDGKWIDVPRNAPRWLVRSNQLPTVRWWGLVERPPSDDPKRKHSGLWQPTPSGVAFAQGTLLIPAKAVTYRGIVEGFEGQEITVKQALGKHFDYAEIMGRTNER